ncbi:MAG TPA: sensor histidine kinase N-terminal domain-containing protein [Burkholderiaceae bacterium]|nr:sensor histidine kinase N-terminal domain-containing protein [Burkholderiaceae bacterium]
MLVPLLLLWPLSLALTYAAAQKLAHQPFDRELGEMARAVARQVVFERVGPDTPSRARLRQPEITVSMLHADDTDQIYFRVLGTRGEHVAGDNELPVPDEPPVLHELLFRDDQVHGEPVRVAYLWVPPLDRRTDAPALVLVAETLGKRSRLAAEIIKGVIFPQYVILPLAVVLVWFALERGLAPLNALQQRIRRRSSEDLSPIDEREAPQEVAPLVQAINELLARLDRSIGAQKHFLADAAHQLKTPLAGLRTQAELAQREIDAGQQDARALKRSLQQIAHSSQRAAHMVNKLLAMARAEDKASAIRLQELRLARLAREVVRDFVPRAMEKRIDLGYEGPDDDDATRMLGQPLLIRELIRNLVDNALRYTPSGGVVTVRVTADPFGQVVVLQVEDSGPGIAEAERELVFRPFYRALDNEADGSGLGLAIVKEIASRHDSTVTVGEARMRAAAPGQGPGALFTLRFALAGAAA